jgi:hypothetical protein
VNERVELRVYVGVFLISLASLALEVLHMRIFAYALWHHLAFLVVSIAILGFGAAGAFLSVAGPLRRARVNVSMAWAGLFFMVSTLVGPWFLTGKPVDVFNQIGFDEVLTTIGYYALFALPYFFCGWIISLTLARGGEAVPKLYFANMVGSGVGCFALFGLLEPLGAPGTLVLIAGMGAVVCVVASKGIFLRAIGVLSLLGCVSLLPGINEHAAPLLNPLLAMIPKLDDKDQEKHPHKLLPASEWFDFQPTDTKFVRTYTHNKQLPQTVLKTEWSPLGRIDIVSDPTVAGACLFQDGDAPGQMPHIDHVTSPLHIHSIGYQVKESPNVLIIGIGGGLDIKTALDRKAKQITAVEINPTTLRLYKEDFKSITGYDASRENLALHCAEGRHFIRSTDAKYDLIQMSGVDTYTALANGAYVLSESYLYTREAFRDYIDSLQPNGLVAMIRFAWPKPRETLRAMNIAMLALADAGKKEPWNHIALLRNEKGQDQTTRLGVILIKESPFTAEELKKLRTWGKAASHSTDYLHDETGDNPFHELAKAHRDGKLPEFLDSYEFVIGPVYDDAPFFFAQHRWSSVWEWLTTDEETQKIEGPVWVAHNKIMQKRPVGLMLLGLTLIQLAVLVALLIFVPLLLLWRSEDAAVGAKAPLGYFFCLGLGYILLMIACMQRFSLILGHPTYSVTITMATFLIGSGVGSLASGAVGVRHLSKLVFLVAIGMAAGAWAFWCYQDDLAAWLLSMPFETRVAATVGILTPFAFLMGTCFPSGIRVLSETRAQLVPWAYGVNGAASVLGSVLTVVLAMAIGFTKVQWASAAFYVLAAMLMLSMSRARAQLASSEPVIE